MLSQMDLNVKGGFIMRKKYLFWALFLLGIFSFIIRAISQRFFPWGIIPLTFFAILTYWIFLLTKCKFCLVAFFYILFIGGIKIFDYFNLNIGDTPTTLGHLVFLVLFLIFYRKEKEIMVKKFKEMNL